MSPAKAKRAKRVNKIPTMELKRPSRLEGFLRIYKEAQNRRGAGQKDRSPKYLTKKREPIAPTAPM
jgi:hypothetical protein